MSTDLFQDELSGRLKEVQDHITTFLEKYSGQKCLEECWTYEKGQGGGRSRIWEGDLKHPETVLEKGGVNFSDIIGTDLPASAATQFKIAPGTTYRAMGVSLVIHPVSPIVPTIHMNVRYFHAGDTWWFGGGIDLTPTYPKLAQVIDFHKGLKAVCDRHGQDFNTHKDACDKYFVITHRNEARGIGGIFFDHMRTADLSGRGALADFIIDLGKSFVDLYRPFLEHNVKEPYTPEQREFQLMRRGRYVEFNLVYDRGTKFGLQSGGRIESILMSLPATACWKYNWKPTPGTPEQALVEFYLKPQDWINMSYDFTISTTFSSS